MNRYRTVPGLSNQQRTTATTVCQKCLKKDMYISKISMRQRADELSSHYSYECKVTDQERPYISRPSRTQQLLNPKLAPKLLSDVPNDLLQKKGVADNQLAKLEEGRGRPTERQPSNSPRPSPDTHKRPRSVSSETSYDSISTISTNRSASPKRRRQDRDVYMTSQEQRGGYRSISRDRKRRHRSSSSTSASLSKISPNRRASSPNRRRRQRTQSPEPRGRPSSARRGSRRSRSHSASVDKSRIARSRKSMTPQVEDREDRRRGDHRPAVNGSSSRHNNFASSEASSAWMPRMGRAPRRERSLSPYSQRLALTQAMNMGR